MLQILGCLLRAAIPLVLVTVSLAAHDSDTVKALAQAEGHISSRSSIDRVLIVKSRGRLFVQMVLDGHMVQERIPGSFVWKMKTISGLQLRDLTGDDLQDIICASSDGASSGANIRVLHAHNGKLVLISPRNAGAYDFDFREIAGRTELILFGKWTEGTLSTVEVLRWNGSQLILAKQEGEAVFKQKLEIESKNVLSSEPQPADL